MPVARRGRELSSDLAGVVIGHLDTFARETGDPPKQVRDSEGQGRRHSKLRQLLEERHSEWGESQTWRQGRFCSAEGCY